MREARTRGPIEQRLTRLDVLGVPLTSGEPEHARTAIEAACETGDEPQLLAYANAHTLNVASSQPGYREVLRRCDFVLNDGIGVSLAARLKGVQLPANLNGSDFTHEVLRMSAQRGWPVFLLGARPGVAQRAGRTLEREVPGLAIAGTHHGYFTPDESPAVARAVRRSGAEVLMVGMGNPRQELWLAEHVEVTGVRLGTGVGAFLDFVAGEVSRAPRWMNRTGVEWLYRLAQEPRRMWRRYVVGNPLFLWRVVTARLAEPRS